MVDWCIGQNFVQSSNDATINNIGSELDLISVCASSGKPAPLNSEVVPSLPGSVLQLRSEASVHRFHSSEQTRAVRRELVGGIYPDSSDV